VVLVTVVEDGHHSNGVIAVVVWVPSSEQRGWRRALENDIVEAVCVCMVLAGQGEVVELQVAAYPYSGIAVAREKGTMTTTSSSGAVALSAMVNRKVMEVAVR
jgi:hypothetical protein